MSETVAGALARTTERLGAAGCEPARVDAEILVAHVLGTTRSGLALESGRSLTAREATALERLVRRRESREPLAYVLGEWGFRRLTLATDARALVPRPETEVVVERCLALLAGRESPRVLDVGTGSGAIALALADEVPGARVTGIDASRDALALAAENVARTGLAVELRHADLFDGLPEGPWDLVVSNPPYVSPADVESLAPEVREWEPRAALVGEGATEAVARGARDALAPGGTLVLEVADGDAARVAGLLRDLGYTRISVTEDLAGRDRVVEGATTYPRGVTEAERAVAAIRAGELVVLPTDTVYGLVCSPYREVPVLELSRVKGRSPEQPIALVAASVDWLLECVPELRGRAAVVARALLPGPYTLVLPNPARRFPWLTGSRPDTIGVRVPTVEGAVREVLDAVCAVAATSANLHGGADPRRLDEVEPTVLEAVSVALDGGELPGTPSTVLDLTGAEPEVLREGAISAQDALERLAAVRAE